jgi:hypothetical protein
LLYFPSILGTDEKKSTAFVAGVSAVAAGPKSVFGNWVAQKKTSQ